jgi:hypothetical protein
MSRVVFAVSALVALSVSLSGCGDSTPPAKPIPPIGGFYTDSTIFDPSSGSFKGLYVISDRQADELTKKLHIIGSDDGDMFWNVHGEWTDEDTGKFVAYFSHIGMGRQDDHGTLSEAGIAWNSTGKSWAPSQKPASDLTPATFSDANKVGGLYAEKTIYKKGQDSFAGVRIIGANYFPNITIVGTDDGATFWSIIGKWDKTPGQFRADFTPIRPGDMNTTGKVDQNAILWGDGQWWQREGIAAGAPTTAPPTSIAV